MIGLQNLDTLDVTHKTINNVVTNDLTTNNISNNQDTTIMGNHVLGNKYTEDGMYNTGMQTFKLVLLL